jgi:hypothetical protein
MRTPKPREIPSSNFNANGAALELLQLGTWNLELTFSPSLPNAPARDVPRISRSTAAIGTMETLPQHIRPFSLSA